MMTVTATATVMVVGGSRAVGLRDVGAAKWFAGFEGGGRGRGEGEGEGVR